MDEPEVAHVLKRTTARDHHANEFCWCKPELHVGRDERGRELRFYYHRAVN
jgi:hypothetical protein